MCLGLKLGMHLGGFRLSGHPSMGYETGHGMVVAGKRCIGIEFDASGAVTTIYVVDNVVEAMNSLVVVC